MKGFVFPSPLSSSFRAGLVWNLAAGGLYSAAALLGLKFASLHDNVSPFWPAAGVGVAAFFLGGRRLFPGIFGAAFLANLLTPVPVFVTVCIALGNAASGLAGAGIVRGISRQSILQPFHHMAAWTSAAALAPVVSAFCGVTALWVSGQISFSAGSSLFLTWWAGDAIGLLVTAPLVCSLAAAVREGRWPCTVSVFQAVGFAVVFALVCWWVFFHPHGAQWFFLLFPLLLLAAMGCGGGGVHLACFGLVTVCVVAVEDGFSLTPTTNLNDAHLQMLGILFSLALTAQLLSVLRENRCVLLPALTLLAGWILGGCFFASLQQQREKMIDLRFDTLVAEAGEAIRGRLNAYVDALRGGASLFAASENVTRREWCRYVDSLNITSRYPGVSGLGVIFPVKSEDLSRFEQEVAADGAPGFSVHKVPGEHRPPRDPAGWDHFVITYIEPYVSNEKAVGLDVASEDNRQQAARLARDYDAARITDTVTLVQDGENRPGFLLFVPIYRFGVRPDTVHERRLHFRGWVYAPFVTQNFMEGVLGSRTLELDLRVFAGTGTDPSRLIFQTHDHLPASFDRTTVLQLGGQEFTCAWNRGPGYREVEGDPHFAAATLAIVPVLLAGLVLSLQTTTRRANHLADEKTRELRLANEELGRQMVQRERAEEEARRAGREAEAANRAKGEFLATMSHEIRTPMNGVIGYADLLAASPLPAEQREWASIIQTSGRALLAIINDILDFSKIESGNLKLETIPFDPVACGRDVLKLLKVPADQKAIPLILQVESEIPRLLGDPTRFKQILLNLVSNGVKFTEKGSVRLGLDWRPSGCGGVLRVDVTDTGIGIPEDKQETLFERFAQVDSSTTRRYGGTGLGLPICKHLVELMQGRIDVASVPGAGTTIGFEIPFQQAPPPEGGTDHGEKVSEPVRTFAKRVLLAEDVVINQRLATLFFKKLGCAVDVAENGRKAVEMALSFPYDIVYMDCQMPELDGLAATREIRRREKGHMRIVALTAGAQEKDHEECLAAGMDDYVTKPLTLEDLTRTLSAL